MPQINVLPMASILQLFRFHKLEKLIQQKEGTYRNLCLAQKDSFKLSPGSITLLNYLKTNNIPRTIATASEISNLNFFFEHLELGNWFDFDRIVYDDGIRPGKPAPDNYLEAAKRIEQLPSDCIVTEDSISGIKSAQNAGIGHIIGLGPKATHRNLYEKGVDEALESFENFNYELISQ